ncbi:hypothetical protein [Streptomyces sp. LaBMicrA B280]|uniref:hypothetical protein n=1 Tax=Streptomyces sp. LaBMicrA B280 TaxID=3391001 RepID=UPI003BA4A45C
MGDRAEKIPTTDANPFLKAPKRPSIMRGTGRDLPGNQRRGNAEMPLPSSDTSSAPVWFCHLISFIISHPACGSAAAFRLLPVRRYGWRAAH